MWCRRAYEPRRSRAPSLTLASVTTTTGERRFFVVVVVTWWPLHSTGRCEGVGRERRVNDVGLAVWLLGVAGPVHEVARVRGPLVVRLHRLLGCAATTHARPPCHRPCPACGAGTGTGWACRKAVACAGRSTCKAGGAGGRCAGGAAAARSPPRHGHPHRRLHRRRHHRITSPTRSHHLLAATPPSAACDHQPASRPGPCVRRCRCGSAAGCAAQAARRVKPAAAGARHRERRVRGRQAAPVATTVWRERLRLRLLLRLLLHRTHRGWVARKIMATAGCAATSSCAHGVGDRRA